MRRRAGARIVLAWEAADREGVDRRLIAAGFASTGRRRVAVPGLEVEVRQVAPGRVAADRLRLLAVDAPERPADPPPVSRQEPLDGGAPGGLAGRSLPAVAIATVDADRAVVAFGGRVGPSADDPLLGAWIAATATPGILVTEPSTEGRLAAALARRGEGPAVIYVATAIPSVELQARLAAVGASWRTGGGPFGPAVLATAEARWGPHLVLVPAAAGPPASGPPASGASATIEA